MRIAACALLAFALAAGLGLSATWWTVAHGLPVGGLTIGAWRAQPSVGGPDANSYLKAGMARRGDAPLAAGDGLAFTALADDDGRPLDAACDYVLEGEPPTARLWTLALFNPSGGRLAIPNRTGLTSADAVRTFDDPLRIALSHRARPGNWIPLTGSGRFVLRLALYDTVVGTTLERATPKALMTIRRGACR